MTTVTVDHSILPDLRRAKRGIRGVHFEREAERKKCGSVSERRSWQGLLRGLKKGLGDQGEAMIVKEISHELSEPSIESQVADCMAPALMALFS